MSPRSKVDQLIVIDKMTQSMVVTLARIKSPKLLEHGDGSEKLPATMIREAYHWLHDIYNGVFADVKKVRLSLTEEVWERYENWGVDDMRETVVLNAVQLILKKQMAVRRRPDFFKKGKVKDALKGTASTNDNKHSD